MCKRSSAAEWTMHVYDYTNFFGLHMIFEVSTYDLDLSNLTSSRNLHRTQHKPQVAAAA